jgi:surface antigen
MNQPQNGSTRQRKVLIGTSIAAVVVAVAGVYLWDTPSDGVSGTIVPAQRYRVPNTGG